MPKLSAIAEEVLSTKPPTRSLSALAEEVLSAPAPKPTAPEPTQFTYDLNLDKRGVPLPVVSQAALKQQYAAPVEKAKSVTPKGPGLKDVEIGARQGVVGLVRHYADPAAAVYGGRLASGRTLGEAAEEHLGPNPEDVEARQGTASKIIQGTARAPFDIAPYALAPGNPAAGMAGVDAFRATGDPEAGLREVAGAGAHGAVMGAALGPLGKYRRAVRVPVAGVGLGAIPAAMEGAGTSDIVASGVVMGGLSGLHGKREKLPELPEPRQQTPAEWAKAQDYDARFNRPPLLATPGAPLGEAPKMPLDRLMEREGVPVERETPADAEWWRQQPETRPEREAGYEKLFTRAEVLEAPKPPQVPETGIPEGVARGMDARERIAREVGKGKSWDELTPAERLVVDDLIAEGYTGAGGTSEPARLPQLETPGKPAAPKRAPISEIAEKVLAEPPKPTPEPKPYALTPEEQAALRSQNAPEPELVRATLMHGSPGRLNELQAGSMLTDAPEWAAGYTTTISTKRGGIDESFTGMIHEATVESRKPYYSDTLHNAEQALYDLAKSTGKQFSGMRQAAEIVNQAFGYDAIIAKKNGKITGAIPLTPVSPSRYVDPVDALSSIGNPLRIPSNLQEPLARAMEARKATNAPPIRTEAPAARPVETRAGEPAAAERVAPVRADAEIPAVQPVAEVEFRAIEREDGGVLVSAIRGGREVGSAITTNLGNGRFELNEVRVGKDFRRQGIGSALYDQAAREVAKIGGKLYTSPEMTDAGRALVNSLDKHGRLGNNERTAGAYRREIKPNANQAETRRGGPPEQVPAATVEQTGTRPPQSAAEVAPQPSPSPVRKEVIPASEPVVARAGEGARRPENAPSQRILQAKGEPEPPALAGINARIAEKAANQPPWAKAVEQHGQAEKRFVELLQSKKPDAKALAEAAAEVDRLAEPLKGQIRGPVGYAITASEIAEVYGKTPNGRTIREKPVDVDAIRDRNAAEFMEYHKRPVEPEIPTPGAVEAKPQTPPPMEAPRATVEFGKPSMYDGRKRVMARVASDKWDSPQLTIQEEFKGAKTYRVEHRYYKTEAGQKYPKDTAEVLGSKLSLKDAKSLATDYLQRVTGQEPGGKLSFAPKDTQPPVKMPASYNEYAAMSGEDLGRLLTETSKPAKSGERGSFSLKPTGPQTPSEVYAKEQVAKREAARKGPASNLRQTLDKMKAETVDATAPILDTISRAQKEHGFELLERAKIDNQIDRVYRSSALADQFMQDNRLDKAIQMVDDIDYFDQYLIAKQAQAAELQGFKTGRDAARDAALVKEFEPRYHQAEAIIREFDRKLLDYSVDAGIISKDLANSLKTIYPDYVPLNRVFNALEKGEFDNAGKRGVASLSKQTVVQKLMGSEREIENPFASFTEKTYRAFGQGERNKAARTLAGYRDLPGVEGLIREIQPGSNVPADRTFSYLDAGTKRTFETTKEIAAAAKSLDSYQIGVVGQILAAPARIAKLGITGINPVFAARNIPVDAAFTLVTSKYSRTLANPMVFLKALAGAYKHDALYAEMVREGGGFTAFDVLRNQPKQAVAKVRAARSTEDRLRYVADHPISSIADLLRATEDFVGRSEQAGRLRLYEAAKKRELAAGRTDADARSIAVREANNALPNYLRGGNLARALNGAIIYLNAGVQGTRSFVRAMQERPAETSAKVATTLFLPVTLATLWNLSDPERKRAYMDLQEYEKDNNLIFFLPGKPQQDEQGRYKNVVRLKLPPGLNKLTIPVRRFIEQWEGLDPVSFGEVAGSLVGSVSPFENLSDVFPQAIKPTAQAASNYDFFKRRPKVPRRLQDQPPALQVQPYTSGTARKIGELGNVSPIKVEEFVKDTMGGDTGSRVLEAGDKALRLAGKIPEAQTAKGGIVEGVINAFTTARGGELENREYAKRKEVEDAAISKAVERAKGTPFYSRLATEELRQRHLQTVANRARYEVSKVTQTPRYKRMQPEQKVAELERVGTRIARSGVSGRITRPSPPPLRSPRPFEARN